MVRGAVANLRDKCVDGLYAWFFRWPFGDPERAMLCEIGNSELSREKTRHYFIPWQDEMNATLGYDRPLPLPVAVGNSETIDLHIADDLSIDDRRARVVLCINLGNRSPPTTWPWRSTAIHRPWTRRCGHMADS